MLIGSIFFYLVNPSLARPEQTNTVAVTLARHELIPYRTAIPNLEGQRAEA
jgi:hypothetical protein